MIERYTRPEMGKIWTPENRYQVWLRVELAVCEAWNRVGEISDADMETLRKEADFTVDRAFVDRANEIEETTRHDVIAFLTAIEEKVGPFPGSSIWAVRLPTSWIPPVRCSWWKPAN